MYCTIPPNICTSWFQRLAAHDQEHLQNVINDLFSWTQGHLTTDLRERHNIEYLQTYALHNFFYFTLYSVGSVITEKTIPGDIDLLLVTNFFPNAMYIQPKIDDLLTHLRKDHTIHVDSRIAKRYDYQSDARMKIDIDAQGKKSIDLIYQWDVLSPKHWEANDRYAREHIFSIGSLDPQGYNGRLSEGITEVPLSCTRISEAKK